MFLLFVLGCAWSYGVAVCYGDDLAYLLRGGLFNVVWVAVLCCV